MAEGPQGQRGPAHLDVQVQLLPEVVVQGGHLALQALVLGSAIRQSLWGGKGGWVRGSSADFSPRLAAARAGTAWEHLGKQENAAPNMTPLSWGGGGSREVQALPCPWERLVPTAHRAQRDEEGRGRSRSQDDSGHVCQLGTTRVNWLCPQGRTLACPGPQPAEGISLLGFLFFFY